MESLQKRMQEHRRHLHKIPELGFDLPKTYDYVKQTMRSLGYQTTRVAEHGLIAFKEGKRAQTIAFRADMDALNIDEQNNVDFTSKHPGCMHACGHDGHMAMLLGFAEHIKDKETDKTIMFVFEPAEETYGGAKVIVDDGWFDSQYIENIFALHLMPELDEGKIGINEGIMTAQDGDFDMKITGINAHGTQPHLGSDVALAASALTMQYHTILGRSNDPLRPGSINIGTMNLGEGRNIIAHEAFLTGSIRAFDHETFTHLKNRMRQIDHGIETAYNVTINNDITDLHPPVHNDKQLFSALKDSLQADEYTLMAPQMLAEDFSYYQQKVPGLFIMLGSKNIPLGYTAPLHSNQFNFDEAVLMKGVEILDHIARLFGAIKE